MWACVAFSVPPSLRSPTILSPISLFLATKGGRRPAAAAAAMPRPGPRPYECVRRAWHSERHQPIRGSVIQELFRVANEIHRSSTRRNKEWQQKLPFVVLKAEEIMYSKAKSEAEYVDLKTLLERANDAIDTIIRREDSDDTGDFLQPCIEAALNLGCAPRRASRSERHNAPRCYLSSRSQEPMEKPLNHHHQQQQKQQQQQQHRCLSRPPGSNQPIDQQQPRGYAAYQFGTRLPPLGSPNYGSPGAPTGVHSSSSMERRDLQPAHHGEFPPHPYMEPTSSDLDKSTSFSSNAACVLSSLGRVYPLYYPPSYQSTGIQCNDDGLGGPQCLNSTFGGGSLSEREIDMCCLYNFLGPKDVEGPSEGSLSSGNVCRNVQQDSEFDLSLRLGPPSKGVLSGGRILVCEVEDVASNCSFSGSRL